MTPTKPVLLLAASGLALTLAGCKIDNRPLLARGPDAAPADYAALPQPGLPGSEAPYAGNLPPPPPPLPPARAYPYAERAYGLDRAFYQAPPDYGFAYGDEEPWAWEAADDSLMFAEPYGEDYRFYYYEPGSDYPYFVRDANYGYAYGDGGVLLALFDATGALLSGNDYGRYYPSARQYWSRGYDLRSTFARGQRLPVDPGVWRQRAPIIARVEQPWMAAPERQPQWRQWRAAAGPSVVQRFEAERPARAAAAFGRADNGLHLGWDRGRHEGWDKHGGPPAMAAAPPPRFEGPQGFARQDRGGRFERQAPNVQGHGRDAVFRGPEARMAQAQAPNFEGRGRHGGGWQGGGGGPQAAQSAPQPAPQGGGWQGGHGRRGGEGPHFAQAAPQPAPQAGGNWTAAHDHGGGHGGPPPAQPQAQPQAQAAPQGGGQGHGNGGGDHGKGGQGGQGGQGDQHGHGHGH